MIDTSLAMSQTDGRTNTHFPPRGRLITQHGAIGDSHRIRGTFGTLSSRSSAKDGHRHVAIKKYRRFLIPTALILK